MSEMGFTNHPDEWWHYNYGNQPWAEETGSNLNYDSAEQLVLEIEKKFI